MPLELPDFRGTSLEQLDLCGFFPVESEADLVPIRRQDGRHAEVATYRVENGQAWLRFGVGMAEPQRAHVHIGVASERHFRRRPPAVTSEIQDVLARIDRLVGRTGQVFIDGRICIPIDTLPRAGIIRAMYGFDLRVGQIGLVLNGAKLAVTGDPLVSCLTWGYREEDGVIYADLDGTSEMTIGDRYLVDAMVLVTEAGNRLVLGEAGTPNA